MDKLKMLTPGIINGMTTKNRIIRSATNDHLGNPDGTVSDAEIEMYDALARNDVGTVITGHLSVSPDLRYRADEMQLCIGDDKYIGGLRRIAEKLHEYGSVAIAQLSLAGPKGLNPFDFNELSEEQIMHIADLFVEGAARAKKAGFDGVQVHMAHWYFLQAVMNMNLNHRTDRYGGNADNCVRLSVDIVEGIRKRCGDDFIIMVKVNVRNTENDDYLNLLEYYCRKLHDAGVNLVEISGKDFISKERTEALYYLEAAQHLKKRMPSLPLSLVGGIFSKETIEKALEVTEFASLSRALLTQPDFITLLKEKDTDTSRCLHCNKCFEIFATKYKRCVFGEKLPQLEHTFEH